MNQQKQYLNKNKKKHIDWKKQKNKICLYNWRTRRSR